MPQIRRLLSHLIEALYYSRLMGPLHQVAFLQYRPTFDRHQNIGISLDKAEIRLYDYLIADRNVNDRYDLARYYFLFLQLKRIDEAAIPGDVAELGVYKGNTAALIRRVSDRTLHLFDTFEGFDPRDSSEFAQTEAFADVDEHEVRQTIGVTNTVVHTGHFPGTATAIPEGLLFAFVHIDLDLFQPIFAALRFFYPRVSPGGCIVVGSVLSLVEK